MVQFDNYLILLPIFGILMIPITKIVADIYWYYHDWKLWHNNEHSAFLTGHVTYGIDAKGKTTKRWKIRRQ